jgi:1,4-dihydroxy-2-naphthoate polyprenyltransferase
MNAYPIIAVWLREMRANFLVLSVALVSIGGAAAAHAGTFNWGLFLLTVLGVVLAHASVNLFNEYSDWRTGIDDHTMKTPFSGGSGTLQAGLLKPGTVRAATWIALTAAGLIGFLLAMKSGWEVIPLMILGALTAITYSDHLARWGIGEVASGLTLGSFVVMGAYFVQTGAFDSPIIWACVPPGILTALLLFLNEFPDADADREGGRRHLVILLGRGNAAILYSFAVVCVYTMIVLGATVGGLPKGTLLGLASFPSAATAVRLAFRHAYDPHGIVPALGWNVAMVLGTDFLLAAGFLIG